MNSHHPPPPPPPLPHCTVTHKGRKASHGRCDVLAGQKPLLTDIAFRGRQAVFGSRQLHFLRAAHCRCPAAPLITESVIISAISMSVNPLPSKRQVFVKKQNKKKKTTKQKQKQNKLKKNKPKPKTRKKERKQKEGTKTISRTSHPL